MPYSRGKRCTEYFKFKKVYVYGAIYILLSRIRNQCDIVQFIPVFLDFEKADKKMDNVDG